MFTGICFLVFCPVFFNIDSNFHPLSFILRYLNLSSSLIPDMPIDEPRDEPIDVNDKISDESSKQDIEFLQLWHVHIFKGRDTKIFYTHFFQVNIITSKYYTPKPIHYEKSAEEIEKRGNSRSSLVWVVNVKSMVHTYAASLGD